jgi:hypothetical protein
MEEAPKKTLEVVVNVSNKAVILGSLSALVTGVIYGILNR